MTEDNPIRRVSVFSTGHVRIHTDHRACTWRPTAVWLFTSSHWTAPLPINVYVIEHRHGLVLFDTGQDRASVTDPEYFPGGLTGGLYRRLARFEVGSEESLGAGLERLGYNPCDVGTAVVSHLHPDHIGGLGELRRAEVVISQTEWDTMTAPMSQLRYFVRSHVDLPGLHWKRITPEPTEDRALAPFRAGHDLFGDGSLMVLPTPGHTPGSISLLVRRGSRAPLILVGDLTYDAHLLEDGHVPGVGSRRMLRQVTASVNGLRRQHPGLVVLPSHDPGAARRLANAS